MVVCHILDLHSTASETLQSGGFGSGYFVANSTSVALLSCPRCTYTGWIENAKLETVATLYSKGQTMILNGVSTASLIQGCCTGKPAACFPTSWCNVQPVQVAILLVNLIVASIIQNFEVLQVCSFYCSLN